MQQRPKLSLCVPTWCRPECLRRALESGLEEARSLSPGTVEVLVCDNASPDGGATQGAIAEVLARYPELRALRNEKDIGFDLNYLRLVEEARGEYVWVLGDDDAWLPGSVARVIQELELGADACLCLAHACDLDLNPHLVLPWFLDPVPSRVWHLETRQDLIRYFDGCARNAGTFAFISVSILRRDLILAHREAACESGRLGLGYPHLWAAMLGFRESMVVRFIPEPLILNRVDPNATTSHPYHRWMHDLRGWTTIADRVFGDDPEVRDAFCRIVGRNHHDTILNGMRLHADTEAQWQEAKPLLQRAGFSASRIAAVELSFQVLFQDRVPSPHLNGSTFCFADLGMVARAARRIAVLALGSLEDLFHGAQLLAALRGSGRDVRVWATSQSALFLHGFEVRCVEPERYLRDLRYRETEADILGNFAPELMVNLDRNRELWGDDLVSVAEPPGALGFELPDRGQSAELVRMVNGSYQCMLPRDSGPGALGQALDLAEARPALWPPPQALREADSHLGRLGWIPARTVAVIADNPAIFDDPSFRSDIEAAGRDGWNMVGLGGRDTHARLGAVLAPWKDRAVRLAGLNPQSTAAVLARCGRFIGGTPVLRSMALACGCTRGLAPEEVLPHS